MGEAQEVSRPSSFSTLRSPHYTESSARLETSPIDHHTNPHHCYHNAPGAALIRPFTHSRKTSTVHSDSAAKRCTYTGLRHYATGSNTAAAVAAAAAAASAYETAGPVVLCSHCNSGCTTGHHATGSRTGTAEVVGDPAPAEPSYCSSIPVGLTSVGDAPTLRPRAQCVTTQPLGEAIEHMLSNSRRLVSSESAVRASELRTTGTVETQQVEVEEVENIAAEVSVTDLVVPGLYPTSSGTTNVHTESNWTS